MGTIVTATYDLRDTGRRATGAARGWDIPSCVALINSPRVQESARKGDLLGYCGHIPRTLANTLRSVEGAVIGGKYVAFEFATCTRQIECSPEGVVTHSTEFLDTESGEKARKHHDAKVGGFSSAMARAPRTSPGVAIGFSGFDYVGAPNYDGNRGYRAVLDSVDGAGPALEEMEMVLDMVADDARAGEMAAQILASVMPQYLAALQTLERSERDRAALIDRLARAGGGPAEHVMDSANTATVPLSKNWRPGGVDDMRRFAGMQVSDDAPAQPPASPAAQRAQATLRRRGIA